jgi:hypothetical protein
LGAFNADLMSYIIENESETREYFSSIACGFLCTHAHIHNFSLTLPSHLYAYFITVSSMVPLNCYGHSYLFCKHINTPFTLHNVRCVSSTKKSLLLLCKDTITVLYTNHTYTMEQSPSSEANRFSASQVTPRNHKDK